MNLNILAAQQKFVGHTIATSEEEKSTAIMYEYVMAGNGLFIRAMRKEFSVCLPLLNEKIKDLPNVRSGIFWQKPQIPSNIWQEILDEARRSNASTEFKEDVFVICWGTNKWIWKKISRERSWASTIADDTQGEYENACIELHTHPNGAIHFSRADDQDESGKFRIFAILTDIHSKNPSIRFRCGVYDYFFQVLVNSVSDMPNGIIDLNKADEAIRKLKR